jgi:RNA polymerase sigma-70 factor (ECF subfamily)
MRAVCHKNRRALAVLYLKYAPQARSYITSHVSSIADAEDLVQEVFLQVCQGKGRYDGSKGVKPYLLGIAENLIRKYYRRTKRTPGTFPSDAMNGLSHKHHIRERLDPGARIRADQFKRIVRAMETSLTPEAREAVRLRFIEGLGVKEAAEKTGCSIRAFYTRLERAIKALREICRDEQ